MTLAEVKASARRDAIAARAAVDPALAGPANRALIEAVRAAPGRVVSAFWPIRAEIDVRPALHDLAATHDLCLPVVVSRGAPLVFRRWRPGDVLREERFGTFVPQATEELTPEILIVPLAAFDARGFRLGYGGGFYDRTLAGLRAAGGPVTAIGVAYEAQRMAEVPVEATDEPLDLIVTETGPYWPG